MNVNRILMSSLLILAVAVPAAGQGNGGLLGGEGSVSLSTLLGGEVTVSFDSVAGLTPANLGVSTHLVSLLDPLLRARLPATVSILSGFPVLVRIEPPAAGGLAFNGVASIEVRTPALLSLLNLEDSLRIFAAPLGGPFEDITSSIQRGTGSQNKSFRALGTKGGFSEFLVIIDLLPLDLSIGAKLNRLDQILAANAGAIPEAVHAELASELAAARAHSLAEDDAAAIQDLDAFLATVEQHSGADIPDVWRAARDRVNVAGLLRAGAQTLQFSLRLRQDH